MLKITTHGLARGYTRQLVILLNQLVNEEYG